ncbi:unnamed protein product, partial [Prorocentrum cordatum]
PRLLFALLRFLPPPHPLCLRPASLPRVAFPVLPGGANTLDGSSGSPVLVLREGGACVVAGLHQGRSAEAGANYGLRLGPALADAVRRARRASSQAADGAPAAAGHGGGDALCSSAGATGHHPDVHIVRRRG